MTDPMLRPLPVSEMENRNNNSVLSLLRTLRSSNQNQIAYIRRNTVLLGSDAFFELATKHLREGMFKSAKSESKVCEILSEQYESMMKTGARELQEASSQIKKAMTTSDGINDQALRETLWKSSCRHSVLSEPGKNLDTSNATYCRLESRYGEGAEIKEK